MTTTVTINAHAGWDVMATRLDANGDTTSDVTVIPAHTSKDLHVWAGGDLLIHEVPNPVEAPVQE
jgi:hypothetical protein